MNESWPANSDTLRMVDGETWREWEMWDGFLHVEIGPQGGWDRGLPRMYCDGDWTYSKMNVNACCKDTCEGFAMSPKSTLSMRYTHKALLTCGILRGNDR